MDLDWITNRLVSMAGRHRHFLTVVMMSPNKRQIDAWQMLGDLIRESDIFFDFKDHSAIIMGCTSGYGALRAIERYQTRCNGEVDLRYSTATFPTDSVDGAELLAIARQRLVDAKRATGGTVVTSNTEDSLGDLAQELRPRTD